MSRKKENEQKRYIIELETLLELQGPINEALGADIIGQKLKSKSKLKDYTPKSIHTLLIGKISTNRNKTNDETMLNKRLRKTVTMHNT